MDVESSFENTTKAAKRAQRDAEISKNLAHVCIDQLKKIDDVFEDLQKIDKKLESQALHGPIRERKREREAKRKRQSEREHERLEKEWEDVRRENIMHDLLKQREDEERERSKSKKDSTVSRKSSKGSRTTKKGRSKKDTKSQETGKKSKPKNKTTSGSVASKRSEKSGSKHSKKGKSKRKSKSKNIPKGSSGKDDQTGSSIGKDSKKISKSLDSGSPLSDSKSSGNSDPALDPELNAFLEELIMSQRKTPPLAPKAPPLGWTGDDWEQWRMDLRAKSPFSPIRDKYPSETYYKDADKILENMDQETLTLDNYFKDNFMKPEPVQEFESDVTSNLTPTDTYIETPIVTDFSEYPFTDLSTLNHNKQIHQEIEQERKTLQDDLRKRIQGLEEIKKNMEQSKRHSMCHKEEREYRKQVKKEEIAKKLLNDYGIDTHDLPEKSECIFEKYLELQKRREGFQRQQIERRISILKRLLAEEKKKQKDKMQLAGDMQIIPKSPTKRHLKHILTNYEEESPFEDEDDEGDFEDIPEGFNEPPKDATSIEKPADDMDDILQKPRHEMVSVKSIIKKKKKKKQMPLKGKKLKRPPSGKKKKPTSKQLDEESSSVGRDILYPRDWPFENLEPIFNTCHDMQQLKDIPEPIDVCLDDKNAGFMWKPGEVKIKDFEFGHIYHRKVTLTNISTNWLSCYFREIELTDTAQIPSFEITNLFPRRVCAGLSFEFNITFRPQSECDEVLGKMIFVVESDSHPEPQYFCIPIDCNSIYVRQPLPYATPAEIDFKNVRECSECQERILKLVNPSCMDYIASIRKIGFQRDTVKQDVTTEEQPKELLPPPIPPSMDDKYNLEGTATSALDELLSQNFDHEIKYVIDECLGKVHKLSLQPDKHLIREALKIDPEDIVKRILDDWMGKISKFALDASNFTKSFMDEILLYVSELSRNARIAVKYIIDQCINTFQDYFKFNPMYYIPLASKSTVDVKVQFCKSEAGVYAEEYIVQFEDPARSAIHEQNIICVANVLPFPLRVDPLIVSFNTCLFDTEIYQANFSVINDTNYAVKLTSKLPPGMQKHVQIFPSGTYVQPNSTASFSVRLKPRCNLAETAEKFYNKDIEVLDFPGYIHARHKQLEKCPPMKVQVLAIVTSPFELEISPACCNLGVVSTQETVCKVLTLTNKSNAWLDYAFPSTPQCVQVHPNFGLGSIGPGEARIIHLLYSPKVTDIEGNVRMHCSGITGPHTFALKVVAAAARAGLGDMCKKQQEASKYGEYDWDAIARTQIILPEDTTSESKSDFCVEKGTLKRSTVKKEETKKEKSTKKGKNKNKKTKSDDFDSNPLVKSLVEYLDIHAVIEIQNDDISEDSFAEDETTFVDDRVFKNILHCHAMIIDPLCELSLTKLILPATPCCSYSISTFFLRGRNETSSFDCTCGILRPLDQQKSFSACFTFQTNDDQLKIEPNCGQFEGGQDVRLRAIFKPRLPGIMVEAKAREIKSKLLIEAEIQQQRENELLEKKRKSSKKNEKKSSSKKKRKGNNKDTNISSERAKQTSPSNSEVSLENKSSIKGKGKGKKNSNKKNDEIAASVSDKNKENELAIEEAIRAKFDPNKIKLHKIDMAPAEKSLLETFQPYCLIVTVKCLVETTFNPEKKKPRRQEVHRMKIVCPVIKPDIMVHPNSQKINFGTVAVGVRSREIIGVQNLTTDNVLVTKSLLNPTGPFICPISSTIVAPEHILILPITCCPFKKSKEENEYFEIYSGKTIIPIHLKAASVEPKFKITPQFMVYRFAIKEKPSKVQEKCMIEIENNCTAPLPFILKQQYITYIDAQFVTPLTDRNIAGNSTVSSDIEGKFKKSSIKRSTDKKKGTSKEKKGKSKGNKKSKGKIKKSKKAQEKSKQAKKGNDTKLAKTDDELNSQETLIFAKPNFLDFLERQIKSNFEVVGQSGENKIEIPPKQSSFFEVSFNSLLSDNEDKISHSETEKQSTSLNNKEKGSKTRSKGKSSKIKKEKKKEGSETMSSDGENKDESPGDSDPNKPNSYVFASKYDLILGSSTFVQEYVFMAYPEDCLKTQKKSIKK